MTSHVFDPVIGSVERDGFEALGFDPAPRSVPGVQELVRDLQQAAKELEDARASVRRASNNGQAWQGEAADAFSARIAELPRQLDVAQASFTSAQRTMATWQDQLAALQRKADDQEAQAKAAKARRERAEDNPDLDLLGRWIPDEQMEDAKARYAVASAELDSARADFKAIVGQAKLLRSEHDRLAKEAAAAVAKAGADAPDGPGWFAGLVDGIKTLAQAHVQLAKDAMQWAKDHANAIAAVGDLLANVSTMTGLAALAAAEFCPPAGAILDGVSMSFSAAALGVHSTAKAAGADVSWQTLAIDGMGVVPVVGALGKAGKLAMEAKTVDRAVTAGDTSGKFAIGASLYQWSLDLSGLRQMMPRDGGQTAQNVLVPGGALITGLQNAWHDGAQKDTAARASRNG